MFLVNLLYADVGSQIGLKPKFLCGWRFGLPPTTHKTRSRRAGWPLRLEWQGQRQTLNWTHTCKDLLLHPAATFKPPQDELGAVLIPIARMKCTGNFSAALSTSWAPLTIKLHVYVYYYKIKEWVGCNVSVNHLYFYIRLLNMLLHTHKSIWVTKDIEHCLPKTVIKTETVLRACAHGCSALLFRLLTSAYKPSFIFIQDLSACILKCLPWNHTGITKLLYLRKYFLSTVFRQIRNEWNYSGQLKS